MASENIKKFDKFEKLKTLGIPELGEWDDYLQYGFNSNDIDELLAIVKQGASMTYEEEGDYDDNDAVYNYIYAWRVLGQLGDESIIQPLIATLNEYTVCDDEWSVCELPKVFALLGKQAIKPLQQFICIKTNEEYARINASEALFEIYRQDNSLKDEIIQAYRVYLKNPDVFTYELNGLLVMLLMKLEAHELLDFVRAMYKNDIVDLCICGNFDDFEMALGLRKKRSMPEPDYQNSMFGEHVSETEAGFIAAIKNNEPHEFIVKTLDTYSTDDAIIGNIYQLSGYLASIVCSDNYIVPSQWSLDIWGGKEHEPQWQDYQEYKTFNNHLFDYFKSIEFYLDEVCYEPLIDKDSDLNKKNDWCIGFMRGIQYWYKSPEDFTNLATVQYSMIAILASDNAQETFNMMGLGINNNIAETIEHAVSCVYDAMHLTPEDIETYHQPDSFFLPDNTSADDGYYPTVNTTPYVRENKKIGRNEPCPCGSGKKYKKCCINT